MAAEKRVWVMGELKPPVPYREMPNPGEFSFRNYVRKFVGPGFITGMSAVAGFELMLIPYIVTRGYLHLMWLYTFSTVLSCLVLREAARYTIATGESTFTGLFRSKPKYIWALLWVGCSILSSAMPGWIGSGAVAMQILTGLWDWQLWARIGIIGWSLFIILAPDPYRYFKRVVEWASVGFLVLTIVAVCLVCTPGQLAETVLSYFFPLSERGLPWVAAGALGIATVNRFLNQPGGGVGALGYSQWIRAEGYGMASYVPRVSGLTAKAEEVKAFGYIFDCKDPEQKRRFDVWMKYLNVDTFISYGGAAIISTALFSLLAYGALYARGHPPVSGLDICIATAMAVGEAIGPIGFTLTLLGIILRLYFRGTAFDNIGRQFADAIYSESEWARRKPYRDWYIIAIACAAVFGIYAVGLGKPYFIWLLSGIWVTGGFGGSAIHLVINNYRYLPEEIKPSKATVAIIVAWGIVILITTGWMTGYFLGLWE
ncbi:MAG: Nramp family divalent metal transporter [Candidatus Freyarchaeota archaeon]